MDRGSKWGACADVPNAKHTIIAVTQNGDHLIMNRGSKCGALMYKRSKWRAHMLYNI